MSSGKKVLVKLVTRSERERPRLDEERGEKGTHLCDELYKETRQYGELAGWQPAPSVFLCDCLFLCLSASFSSAALTETTTEDYFGNI